MPPQNFNVPSTPSQPNPLNGIRSGKPLWLKIVIALAIVFVVFIAATYVLKYYLVAQQKMDSEESAVQLKLRTYTDQQYGFELEYPAYWNIKEDYQPEYSTIFLNGNTIHVSASNNLTVAEVCDKVTGAFVKINNQTKRWCTDGNPDDRYVISVQNSYTAVVFYCWFPESRNNLNVCNQVLSSFKFVSTSTPAVDTSNWKTFTNQKYGYKIEYPLDWSVSENENSLDIYGPNTDLASVNIKTYSSSGFENIPQNQDSSYQTIVKEGGGYVNQITYKARYDQTTSQLDQIVSTFRFTE